MPISVVRLGVGEMGLDKLPTNCRVEHRPTEAVKGHQFAVCSDFADGLPGTAILGFVGYRPHAELFAAAADMLAAIERFMPKGIAIGNGNVPDDLCVPMDVTMGELRAFEAAIAKARGAA